MAAYYNEHDAYAAQWLRNLIAGGLIAPGDVDERDIQDVRPDDLQNYTQAHFFAGIGVWSYALRQAGWEDDRPVWTGSCPCQPFSAAGKGSGFADERHLWPAFYHLIRERRPAILFGEQVASKDGLAWLDLVHADMEAADYAFGAFDLCAAGVGAPHIRQRLFFVGVSDSTGREPGRPASETTRLRNSSVATGDFRFMANAESVGLLGRSDDEHRGRWERTSGQGRETCKLGNAVQSGREGGDIRENLSTGCAKSSGDSRRLGDVNEQGLERRSLPERRRPDERASGQTGDLVRPGPTNGYWRDADWLGCTDGKWRPVEPGTFPLVDRSSFRLGSGSALAGKSRAKMLRGYGNAIVAPLAIEFIKAAMECLP